MSLIGFSVRDGFSMAIKVPLSFNPESHDYEEHLSFENAASGCKIVWPLVGVSFLVNDNRYPDLDEVAKLNPGHFKNYGLSGFSIGSYHEFLIKTPALLGNEPSRQFGSFQLGDIEATVGEATPLAAAMFNKFHRDKYHGDWSHIPSLRLFNVPFELGETAFINACIEYEAKIGACLTLNTVFSDWCAPNKEEEEEVDGEALVVAPPIVRDVEPLRFFYSGLSLSEDAAACISYYRVLEYYSSLAVLNELSKLRGDHGLSNWQFFQQVLDMLTKDEKGAIFRLVVSVAQNDTLNDALGAGFIKSPNASLLANEIYNFRNSVVHGKYSYGYTLWSASPLNNDDTLKRWRALLRKLAKVTLERFGSK